jgi:hypothetical protein
MGSLPRVDLYCEDQGHEQFALAVLRRLTRELRIRVDPKVQSGRGGHGRALSEFRAWQRAVSKGGTGLAVPDLLILLIDGNCQGWSAARRELEEVIDGGIFARSVVGCPDPHVERWCLADPEGFLTVVGAPPPPDPGKCERFFYKNLLRRAIRDAGQPILTNEMEYAPDLVRAMDFFRAGKNQPSLRHFVDEVQTALQSLRGFTAPES